MAATACRTKRARTPREHQSGRRSGAARCTRTITRRDPAATPLPSPHHRSAAWRRRQPERRLDIARAAAHAAHPAALHTAARAVARNARCCWLHAPHKGRDLPHSAADRASPSAPARPSRTWPAQQSHPSSGSVRPACTSSAVAGRAPQHHLQRSAPPAAAAPRAASSSAARRGRE